MVWYVVSAALVSSIDRMPLFVSSIARTERAVTIYLEDVGT